MSTLSPEILIKAYALGLFPMAETHDDERVFFVDPELRGVLPITGAHIPRRLRKQVRGEIYHVTVNTAFDAVIDACRERTDSRNDSWINPEIRTLYCALHRYGFAHSVEAWQDDKLVGGLYGVALKGAFFGESMFSRARDASKITLVHLMARLYSGGFALLDTQFTNPHLEQFGVLNVPREEFKILLDKAMTIDATFPQDTPEAMGMVHSFLQARTETS